MTTPTDDVKEKIGAFFHTYPSKVYEKGEVILRAGSTEAHFFYIDSGAVKVTTTSLFGQSLVLHIFNPGSCFSLLTLIQEKNKYDFTALRSTVLHKVPKGDVLKFMHEDSEVMFEFQLRLLKGIQGLLDRTEQSVFMPAYSRVAALLLYFARHFSEHSLSPTQKVIEIKTTHQEISEWLGLSRENVSIHMKQLERDGLIRRQDTLIEVIDVSKLEALLELPTRTGSFSQ